MNIIDITTIVISVFISIIFGFIFFKAKYTVSTGDHKSIENKATKNVRKQNNQHEDFNRIKNLVTSYELEMVKTDLKNIIDRKLNYTNLANVVNRLEKLEKEIQNLEARFVYKNNNISFQSDIGVNKKPLGQERKSTKSVYYVGIPIAQGFREIDLGREFEYNMTLYMVEIIRNKEAKFSFIGDEVATKDALSRANEYIEPVCDPINSISSGTKTIQTLEPGIVLLNGDIWEIKQKAKIRYE